VIVELVHQLPAILDLALENAPEKAENGPAQEFSESRIRP
jgi:hypothetical protein